MDSLPCVESLLLLLLFLLLLLLVSQFNGDAIDMILDNPSTSLTSLVGAILPYVATLCSSSEWSLPRLLLDDDTATADLVGLLLP